MGHESIQVSGTVHSALRDRIQDQIQRRIDLKAEVKEALSELDAWHRAQEEAAALTVRANEVLRRSPPGSPARHKSPEREATSGYPPESADPPSVEPSKEDDPPSAEPSKEADPLSAEPSQEVDP